MRRRKPTTRAPVFESLGIAKDRLTDGAALAQYPGKRRIFQGAGWRRKPGERWLLVTSAYHMPRSVGIFRKAGFAVEPYPVDWRTGGRADLLSIFDLCHVTGWTRVEIAMREWMGLAAYRIIGQNRRCFSRVQTRQ